MNTEKLNLNKEAKDVLSQIDILKKEVESKLPPSRERSLVLTKLDEAILWVVASSLNE